MCHVCPPMSIEGGCSGDVGASTSVGSLWSAHRAFHYSTNVPNTHDTGSGEVSLLMRDFHPLLLTIETRLRASHFALVFFSSLHTPTERGLFPRRQPHLQRGGRSWHPWDDNLCSKMRTSPRSQFPQGKLSDLAGIGSESRHEALGNTDVRATRGYGAALVAAPFLGEVLTAWRQLRREHQGWLIP